MVGSFPGRRVVLVGDTSNVDVMQDYPALLREFDNVRCVLVRNTSATEEGGLPYTTEAFRGLPRERYMFFNTPDSL